MRLALKLAYLHLARWQIFLNLITINFRYIHCPHIFFIIILQFYGEEFRKII